MAVEGVVLGDRPARVVWGPAVVPPPFVFGPLPAENFTQVRVVDTAPVNGAPATSRYAVTPAPIDRVTINGQDFKFYGDAPVVIESFKLIDPLRYGGASIVIPAINPQFPNEDLGDLVEFFQFAQVRWQGVLAGEIVSRWHKGFVSRVDISGDQLRLEVAGEAAGALSQMYVTPTVYKRKQDVEHILVDLLRDARVRAKEHDGASGVGLIKRGGADGLSVFNETLAVWAGSTGQDITFTPNAEGVYRKTQKPGPDDDADFTCYPSDLVEISLAQDFAEQYTRVYAQGFTAAGELVTNIKTPGLTQGEAPTLTGTLLPDDESDQVAALQEQLALHNYLDFDDVKTGVFDADTVAGVLRFKYFAGLSSLTPEIGETAWEALWDLASQGYSLDDSREYPMAQDPRTFKWFRTANGSRLSLNPDYDPLFIPNDLFVDVGGPFGHGEINEYARSKMAPEGGIWSGQIVLYSGVVAGVHNPGDALTTGDILDRRDVLPNMKAWLPWFNDGVTVYVSGVEHTPEQSTLLVSSVPQTTMEVWQALERRKEAKSNPGRAWSGHTRASQVRNDTGPRWDTTSGRIANKVALSSGWNKVEVPAGDTGIVQRVKMQLQDPAEFYVLLTSKEVSEDALNDRIDPSADPGTDPPWYERDGILNWLNKRGYLEAWGSPPQASIDPPHGGQPCGYDPSKKSTAGAAPTGLFVEYASLTYETGAEPVLFVYIWVASSNALMPGRILRNQRTSNF